MPRSAFWRQPWVRAALAVLTLAVMGMIFFFSAQEGDASNGMSGSFTLLVVRYAVPGYDALPPAERLTTFNTAQFFVRKAGHLTEFALLGLCMRLLCHSLFFSWPTAWAWLAGTLYAATDEAHQFFVSQRSAMWQDVLLDSAGVLAGAALGCLIALLVDRAALTRGSRASESS